MCTAKCNCSKRGAEYHRIMLQTNAQSGGFAHKQSLPNDCKKNLRILNIDQLGQTYRKLTTLSIRATPEIGSVSRDEGRIEDFDAHEPKATTLVGKQCDGYFVVQETDLDATDETFDSIQHPMLKHTRRERGPPSNVGIQHAHNSHHVKSTQKSQRYFQSAFNR